MAQKTAKSWFTRIERGPQRLERPLSAIDGTCLSFGNYSRNVAVRAITPAFAP